MAVRKSRESEIAELMRRGKALKTERDEKLRELTERQTKMRVFEAKRDEQYEECREMGVDPKQIDAEIEARIAKVGELLTSYRQRYEAILARAEASTGGER